MKFFLNICAYMIIIVQLTYATGTNPNNEEPKSVKLGTDTVTANDEYCEGGNICCGGVEKRFYNVFKCMQSTQDCPSGDCGPNGTTVPTFRQRVGMSEQADSLTVALAVANFLLVPAECGMGIHCIGCLPSKVIARINAIPTGVSCPTTSIITALAQAYADCSACLDFNAFLNCVEDNACDLALATKNCKWSTWVDIGSHEQEECTD